ncbi:unnamed protein product [Musa hybrid cultivar]
MFLFKAIPLSEDHKPNRSDERKRIENAGGFFAGTWKVRVVLAMSRAFGNRPLKQCVVAEPEIRENRIDGFVTWSCWFLQAMGCGMLSQRRMPCPLQEWRKNQRLLARLLTSTSPVKW